jgi:hypothetical protein
MESRAFIRHAAALIKKIEDSRNQMLNAVELHSFKEATQKEITALFNGLQNPTLPSGYRLRDVCLRNGFFVDQKVQIRLSSFEHISG